MPTTEAAPAHDQARVYQVRANNSETFDLRFKMSVDLNSDAVFWLGNVAQKIGLKPVQEAMDFLSDRAIEYGRVIELQARWRPTAINIGVTTWAVTEIENLRPTVSLIHRGGSSGFAELVFDGLRLTLKYVSVERDENKCHIHKEKAFGENRRAA